MVNEYSRKGFVDGLTCRLPTISVRPGVPNSAASSFASGIIREPLNGVPSQVPVPHFTRMWLSSPRTVVRNLAHALTLPTSDLPAWRVVMFGDRGGRMVAEAFDDVRSALDIFVKDMGLVGEAARTVHQETPLASTAEQLYLRGHRAGLSRKDDSVVYRILRADA